jgi:hypothetical protein
MPALSPMASERARRFISSRGIGWKAFHVRYSGQKALIAIETLAVLRGHISPRALGLVTEWAALHRLELMEDWNLARADAQLKPIAPLE